MVDKIALKVKKLSNKKIKTGENIKDILAYRGISLWWFIEHSVYLSLKGIKSRKITDNKILINLICVFMKIFLIAKLLFRSAFGHLFKIKSGQRGREKILVCSSLWHWREIQNPITLKTRKGDVIVGNIIDSLKKEKFKVLALDRDDSRLIDYKRFYDKLKNGKDVWRPIEIYLTFNIMKNAFKESRRLENKWDKFLQHLSSEDNELFKQLTGDFRIFFSYHIFQAIMYMELAKRAIGVENPKLIIVAGEHADSGRAIVAIGRVENVPTLAIQHGFFTYDSVMYYYKPQEISNKVSPQYHPLPDKIAVYGPWTKNILLQRLNCPKEGVAITGQPRYDILAKAKSAFSREKFYKKFGIDSKKKIVLITTQPFSFEKRETFLRTLLKDLKRIKNIEIVIKPHPVENGNWHKRIANKEKVDVVVLPSSSNTYEALYACDVMITISSTTALEAMVLDKDVIIADFIKTPWTEPYVKSGATVVIKGRGDVISGIERALYNKKVKRKLKKGRKRFVYQHTYKQDGKATQRVVSLVKNMISKSNR